MSSYHRGGRSSSGRNRRSDVNYSNKERNPSNTSSTSSCRDFVDNRCPHKNCHFRHVFQRELSVHQRGKITDFDLISDNNVDTIFYLSNGIHSFNPMNRHDQQLSHDLNLNLLLATNSCLYSSQYIAVPPQTIVPVGIVRALTSSNQSIILSENKKMFSHTDLVTSMELIPLHNTQFLATASIDGSIKLWFVSQNGPECIRFQEEHVRSVSCLSFFEERRVLISGSFDNTVKVWQFNDKMVPHCVATQLPPVQLIKGLNQSPEQQQELLGSSDFNITSLDVSVVKDMAVLVVGYRCGALAVFQVGDNGQLLFLDTPSLYIGHPRDNSDNQIASGNASSNTSGRVIHPLQGLGSLQSLCIYGSTIVCGYSSGKMVVRELSDVRHSVILFDLTQMPLPSKGHATTHHGGSATFHNNKDPNFKVSFTKIFSSAASFYTLTEAGGESHIYRFFIPNM